MVGVSASREPGDFVGRQPELSELRELAATRRLVTLCGAGGIGKTRLLQALLATLAREYPDGTFLVRLGDLRQPDLVTSRVATALGICQEPALDLADTLADALRGRRLILALDGYEHVIRECAALCQDLLAVAPGVLVVAAGREPLAIPGETIWQVPALNLPAAGEADPDRAVRSDAVRLFLSRAAAGFALDDGNCAGVVAACRAVAGLPLAIELAAARAGDLGVARIAAGLSERTGLPGPPGHDIPAPHAATMRAAIEWSASLLDPAEQALLRRLAVLSGWTLEMAEQVGADDALPAAAVGRLLASLAGHALIQGGRGRPGRPGRPGQERYFMPGAVRDYAAESLAEAGDAGATSRRLWDYTVQRVEYLAGMAHSAVPVTARALDELFSSYQADARNVRTALAWCLEHGDPAAGLAMCTEFGVCWLAVYAPAEAARWFDVFLAAAEAAGHQAEPAVRGPALAVRAQAAHSLGDLPGAQGWAAAALKACRAAGNEHFAAIALNVLAQVAVATGQSTEALQFAGEALEVSRPSWDWWNQVYALRNRADALALAGRLTAAREAALAGQALSREAHQHWGTAMTTRLVGDLALAQGDLDTARDSYLAVLPYMRTAMWKPDTAACLASLGTVYLRQGDQARAREYLGESLRISLATGSRIGIAHGLIGFAEIARREGGSGRAVQLAAAATALYAAMGLLPPGGTRKYLDADGLPEDEAARLWAVGLELTTPDAARLALDPPAMAPAAAR
jgi:predicted ATPase